MVVDHYWRLYMISALVVFYFLVAFSLIVLVLLQDPKGNGAIFGGGGSQSLFGATGATSFIVKATRLIAILFAVCVIGINYMLMSESSKSAVYGVEPGLNVPVLETEIETEKETESEGEGDTKDAPGAANDFDRSPQNNNLNASNTRVKATRVKANSRVKGMRVEGARVKTVSLKTSENDKKENSSSSKTN